MNIPNTRRLLAALRGLAAAGLGRRFDLGAYFAVGGVEARSLAAAEFLRERTGRAGCGTTRCLAGLAQEIGAVTDDERGMPAPCFARRWLGLDAEDALRLFLGVWDELPEERRGSVAEGPLRVIAGEPTLPEAIRHLELMLAGEAGLAAVEEAVRDPVPEDADAPPARGVGPGRSARGARTAAG